MSVAIVTGASSGLGAEYVRKLSEKGRVAEIWVIARRVERLQALKEEVAVPVRIFSMDLTSREEMDAFRETLAREEPVVSYLINAAGFGKIGTYRDISRREALNMIRLNCMAAVDMTETVLPYMEKGGRILEIASTAGFQPLQGLNIYAASKAFLLRYARGLGAELVGTGITVTAVCPYWIRDTEFIPVAAETGSRSVRHFPLSSKKKSVVAVSLFFAEKGFPVCTPGVVCTLHRIVSLLPDTILQLGWALIRRV